MNELWAATDRAFKLQAVSGFVFSVVFVGLGIAVIGGQEIYTFTACILASMLWGANGVLARDTRTAFKLVADRLAKLEAHQTPPAG